MPVYLYKCQACGEEIDHVVKYKDRMKPQDCPACAKDNSAKYLFSAVHLGSERKTGENRLIWDEKQVKSEKGERWRDEGTTGKEGGAGGKLYFHD